MSQIKNFLEEICEIPSVPKWVQIKAKLILEEKDLSKTFLTPEEMLNFSSEYFGESNGFFREKSRGRGLVEKKHMIRYALHLNGVSFEKIGDLMDCDRTTTYNSIRVIRDVSSVDDDFKNQVDNFLYFLEVKKIK